MKITKIVRVGGKHMRVQLEDGTIALMDVLATVKPEEFIGQELPVQEPELTHYQGTNYTADLQEGRIVVVDGDGLVTYVFGRGITKVFKTVGFWSMKEDFLSECLNKGFNVQRLADITES